MQIPSKLLPLFETPNVHNIIEGGRGGAKSITASELIVWVMARAPLNILCCRETQKSLSDSSFAVIRDEIYKQDQGPKFKISESRNLISTTNGARAVFIGLKEHTVESIKSYKGFHWVWIEEAHAVSKKSLDVLIPTPRTDGYFRLKFGDVYYTFPLRMFIYTMNPFTWDDAIRTVLPETREDVQIIKINYYDNPWFPKTLEAERIEAKKTMLPDEYDRIWEGIPFEDTERAIMTRKQVHGAIGRNASTDGGIVVGADIARFGVDRTVFVKRQGMKVIDIKIMSKIDTQESARILNDFATHKDERGKEIKGRIIVDDTGVGGGVTDKLQDLKANVVPINFGRRASNKKKYPDIISEMWFNLADCIDDAGFPDDKELLIELSSRHYKYTQDERRKVESKEEYKKRTGRRSPDIADAMILCYYNKGGDMSVGELPISL